MTDISQTPEVQEIIQKALREDVGAGDYSSLSCIDENKISSARLIFKDDGIVAGVSIASEILRMNDSACKIHVLHPDGSKLKSGDIVMEVSGNARALMKSERLLLNMMQRLSGIATLSHIASTITKPFGAKVLDTRKTTPNLRILEKWAVRLGGSENHRFGLFDMVMLKDNHIDIAGGISRAIHQAKQYLNENNLDLGIEVEVRKMEEVYEVLNELPVQRVMLDNFSPDLTKQAVQIINGRCETEASGGITLDNLEEYAKTGVDFISLGMLTHSVKSLDMSFKINKE